MGWGMKDGPYRVPCPVARLPDCQRHTFSIEDTRPEMRRTRTVRTQRGTPSPLCAVSQNRILPDGGILRGTYLARLTGDLFVTLNLKPSGENGREKKNKDEKDGLTEQAEAVTTRYSIEGLTDHARTSDIPHRRSPRGSFSSQSPENTCRPVGR